MPGWSGSTRHQRLPPDWPTTRDRILTRDNRSCRWIRADTGQPCGLPANQVDHIHAGDNHADSNLQALCEWHHLRKSGSEGGRAAAAARKSKPKPLHPGLTEKPIDRTPPPF